MPGPIFAVTDITPMSCRMRSSDDSLSATSDRPYALLPDDELEAQRVAAFAVDRTPAIARERAELLAESEFRNSLELPW